MSGGDERLRYRMAGTWFDQGGIVIPSGYRRVGGRLNLDFNPNSRLSLRTSLALSGEHNDRLEGDGSDEGIVTNAFGESPSTPVRLDNGEFAGPDDAGLVYPNPVALAEFNGSGPQHEHDRNVEARFRSCRSSSTPAASGSTWST